MSFEEIETIFNNKKKENITIFFCGIGGIGMSGLCLLAKSCGYNVLGSDCEENKNTIMLKQENVKVFIGHNINNLVCDIDIFVYSSAVDINSNVEAVEVKKRKIPLIKRGDFLVLLMKNYFNIVVAGSHGKTTTTAIIGHLLQEMNCNPNILVGGVLNSCHSNCKVGDSKYFVVESDESDGTFEEMPANIGVITNIDLEHMWFYKTEENLEQYFFSFAKKSISKQGLVLCIDSKIGRDILKQISNREKLLTYSIFDKMADLYADNIILKKDGIECDVYLNKDNLIIKNVFIANMFGAHNVSNTLASFGIARLLNLEIDKVSKSFVNFSGIQKRFTILGKIKGTFIIDDYAHNPQKIKACIDSAKHYMKCNNLTNGLTIVFEPHRYTRIRDGMEKFSDCMKNVDNIIVLPIYASSETKINGINDNYVYNELKKNNKNTYKCNLNEKEIYNMILDIKNKNKTDLVVFMGAGKSSYYAHKVIELYGDSIVKE